MSKAIAGFGAPDMTLIPHGFGADQGAAIASALERERHRVADELHDTAIQQLVLARILIDRSFERGAPDPLDQIRQVLDDALEQLRSLVLGLTPAALCRRGLCPAIAWLCEQLGVRWGVAYRYRVVGDAISLPEALTETLVQGARELMTNVGRHAHASTCDIVLSFNGDSVELTVRDDGIGVHPDRGADRIHGGGFGLLSLRMRSEELGGALQLGAGEGGGTRAVLRLPLPRAVRSEHLPTGTRD